MNFTTSIGVICSRVLINCAEGDTKISEDPEVKSNLVRPVASVIIVNAEGWLVFQRNCNMVTCQFSLLLILRLLNSY